MTIRHHDAGALQPCIRVLHQFLDDGTMRETIHLLDPEDQVRITVPEGYALVPRNGGYILLPAP